MAPREVQEAIRATGTAIPLAWRQSDRPAKGQERHRGQRHKERAPGSPVPCPKIAVHPPRQQ